MAKSWLLWHSNWSRNGHVTQIWPMRPKKALGTSRKEAPTLRGELQESSSFSHSEWMRMHVAPTAAGSHPITMRATISQMKPTPGWQQRDEKILDLCWDGWATGSTCSGACPPSGLPAQKPHWIGIFFTHSLELSPWLTNLLLGRKTRQMGRQKLTRDDVWWFSFFSTK